MKHLIALARKYLQRQKLRTMLSFLCIMLSVFVFNLFIMAAILIRSVALGALTDGWGYWHMDLAAWINEMPEPDKIGEILPNHVAVDNYLVMHNTSAGGVNTYGSNPDNRTAYYMTFSVNDVSEKVLRIEQIKAEGNNASEGNASFGARMMAIRVPERDFSMLAPDEIILPAAFQEKGFRTGDVVTITVTPNRGTASEDSPGIQPYITGMLKDEPEKAGLPWFADSPGAEEAGGSVLDHTLVNFLVSKHLLSDAKFTDNVSGEPIQVSMRIAGFNRGFGSSAYSEFMPIITSLHSKLDITQALQGEFAPAPEEDMTVSIGDDWKAFIAVTDKIDFDDAAEMIYRDLGLPEAKMLELVHPIGDRAGMLYNREVLALEFRGMDAITTWMTTLLPALVTLILLTFVFWALMRFVIDNAFEISVQERSAQFSMLRIMGASRRQIALLVCMEALAYSAAAIPLGMLAAYGCKHMIVSALEKVNIAMMDDSMPMVTVIGVVLSLAAIFISAYTSSMWAARAYGPLEGTKRTDLKGNKRETIWNKNLFGKTHAQKISEQTARRKRQSGDLKAPRKAKLNRKRSGFLLHYTMRNIRRTRKRFLISVITMTLGCGLFSFGISAGGCLLTELIPRQGMHYTDFMLSYNGRFRKAIVDDIEAKFGQNPNFTDWTMDAYAWSEFESESFAAAADALLPEDYAKWFLDSFHVSDSDTFNSSISIVTRREYEQIYEETAGISYDAFVASNSGIFCYSAYGTAPAYLGAEDIEKLYPTGFTKAKGEPPVLIMGSGDRIPMTGALAIDLSYQGLVIAIPADNAETLMQSYMNMPTSERRGGEHIRVELTVAGSSKYEAASEELIDYVSHINDTYEGEMELQDTFVENTGLKYVISAIGIICMIALLAVWGVGIFTMLNTINTGVLNRCNELMMLRMIGMSQKQMRRTVSLESIIYCSISTVIGGILGIAACLYLVVRTVFDVTPLITFAILFTALLLTLLINTLIAYIAAKPGLRALHQRVEAGKMMQ